MDNITGTSVVLSNDTVLLLTLSINNLKEGALLVRDSWYDSIGMLLNERFTTELMLPL
jgi:hypothetical protein